HQHRDRPQRRGKPVSWGRRWSHRCECRGGLRHAAPVARAPAGWPVAWRPMSTKVAVVGSGSWGTAVAAVAAQRASVVLWARRPEVARAIDQEHRNSEYLPEHPLPAELRGSSELAGVLGAADVVVMAVPSHGFRAILEEAAPHLPAGAPVVSLTK